MPLFCTKCGNSIEDTSKFCTSCGASSGAIEEVFSDNDVLLEIRPHFIGWACFWYDLPGSLILSLFALPILGYFSPLIMPFLVHFGQKQFFKKTVFRFYKTRVECEIDFIMKYNKTLKYKNILDPELKIGFLQQKHNVGTIMLSAALDDGAGGLWITNVLNPEVQYQKIKELIANSPIITGNS